MLRSCLSAGYKLSESLCALGMTRARSRPSAGHMMTYCKVVYIFFKFITNLPHKVSPRCQVVDLSQQLRNNKVPFHFVQLESQKGAINVQ